MLGDMVRPTCQITIDAYEFTKIALWLFCCSNFGRWVVMLHEPWDVMIVLSSLGCSRKERSFFIQGKSKDFGKSSAGRFPNFAIGGPGLLLTSWYSWNLNGSPTFHSLRLVTLLQLQIS